jgi:septum formation protein
MILASHSPRRIELMSELGFSARSVAPDIDESMHAGESPEQLVERLARTKAHSILDRKIACPGEPIIAADTVVALDDEVLGKPADEDDARRMLRVLSGETHRVSTGVCIVVASEQPDIAAEERAFVETTKVRFYPLSKDEIASYVATGEPADKAGAYGIQGTGRLFVEGIEGDYFNVVGLPVARLWRELRDMGIATDVRPA